MVEMTVDSVRINVGNRQPVVILKDTHEDRYLFIWIAQPESQAILQELQGVTLKRPLTHDLLKSVITKMGGRVTKVTITALRDSVYHASITIDVDGKELEIDSRTSDAIALAVRVKCPIFAAESVLDEAAVIPDESEKPSSQKKKTSGDNLSLYRDFINNLDSLDDFGKPD